MTKPESLTDQIFSTANGLAHKWLLGHAPGKASDLSEVSLASMTILGAVLEALTVEQRQSVLDKLNSL